MGRRVDSAAWDERRKWIERQASSGISAARFCRENGLIVSNFHAWKRKLNGGAGGDWRMHSDGRHRVLRLKRQKQRDSAEMPVSRRLAAACGAYVRAGRPNSSSSSLFVLHPCASRQSDDI